MFVYLFLDMAIGIMYNLKVKFKFIEKKHFFFYIFLDMAIAKMCNQKVSLNLFNKIYFVCLYLSRYGYWDDVQS